MDTVVICEKADGGNFVLVPILSIKQTVQSTTVSATTPGQLLDLLHSLEVVPKLTAGVIEDIDKILGNKPTRPPMISTLQQRWATYLTLTMHCD